MSTALSLLAATTLVPADVGSTFYDIAWSGSLLLAVPVAVVAGALSFFSPCVLPLVPGYLSYVTGMTGTQLAGSSILVAVNALTLKRLRLPTPTVGALPAPMGPPSPGPSGDGHPLAHTGPATTRRAESS